MLGSVLGLFTFLFDPFTHVQHAYSAGKIALIFLTSILLVSFPVIPERGRNLFNFNAPAWSLFWEYIANIFYALVLWRIGRRLLQVMLVFAALRFVTLAIVPAGWPAAGRSIIPGRRSSRGLFVSGWLAGVSLQLEDQIETRVRQPDDFTAGCAADAIFSMELGG